MVGKVLAIIPARKGSKRVEHKNKRSLGKVPLIEWTFQAAFKHTMIDKVVVTTDDLEIIKLSENYNFDTIQREKNLCTDTATTADVVLDVLNQYPDFQTFILLQPTSPFRNSEDISRSLQMYRDAFGCRSLVSACVEDHSPLWSFQIDCEGCLKFLGDPSDMKAQSQSLPKFYKLNGAIFIRGVKDFIRNPKFVEKESLCYEMPVSRSLDIDTLLDFRFAEALIETGYSNC